MYICEIHRIVRTADWIIIEMVIWIVYLMGGCLLSVGRQSFNILPSVKALIAIQFMLLCRNLKMSFKLLYTSHGTMSLSLMNFCALTVQFLTPVDAVSSHFQLRVLYNHVLLSPFTCWKSCKRPFLKGENNITNPIFIQSVLVFKHEINQILRMIKC